MAKGNIKKKKRRKGTFADLRLPVSKQYVYPFSRKRMVWIGVLAAVLALIFFVFNASVTISNGPLSSNHANFEDNCIACHTETSIADLEVATVADEKCMVCHEKSGEEIPVHSFAGHYLYRSFDVSRVNRVGDSTLAHEKPCFTCHGEHLGRNAPITDVSDSKCLSCHDYGSFNDRHPQFAFVKNNTPDPANLKFNHVYHIRQIFSKESADTTVVCLTCHNPQPDGKNFEALDFEKHCAKCHLGVNSGAELPNVILKSANKAGAVSLDRIRRELQPGSAWAVNANEAEYDISGGYIEKLVVYHKDPWVLDNLRRLRGEMYDASGISELIDNNGDVPRHESVALYEAAITSLESYMEDLQSHPSTDVQVELKNIAAEISEIKRMLKYPHNLELDYGKFRLTDAELKPFLKENANKLAEYEKVVSDLTVACQKCHLVKNAAIVSVQKSQRALFRSEFNHRAHILQRDCVDCHNGIDFRNLLKEKGKPALALDNAGIQNLPAIANCQSCHSSENTSNRCIICHQFHPNKLHQANLLLRVN